MPIPTWLLQHLETTTGGVYTNGRSKHPKIRSCQRCGSRIIFGMCDMWQNVDADVYTVTELGAVWAALDGRRVWRLYGSSLAVGELWERHQFNWSDWPAGRVLEGTGRVNLVIEHRCQPIWYPYGTEYKPVSCPDKWIEEQR